ncbi:MAG TPA: ATP-binding cassette domain-containing protein, partial [Terrimesophilobacter sp.]|uniref:ABC transporter ATP-binding protein n=1 Tax=Terrimesophilobacter sp. TaxID=2906435 RepID=UPI002F924035
MTTTAAPPEPARVELRDVGMQFGERVVTQNINLVVPAGDVLSIVGPSGCGKTTLLRAIAGLLQPAEGSVYVGDESVEKTPEGVAMVFQQFGLFPWKTVEANVAYGLRARGVTARTAIQETRHLIEMVGLSGFEKSYPHQLSGGMQQRTGL